VESYNMTNIEPDSGSLILRGHKIEAGSAIFHEFAVDCTRFIEGLVSEEALRRKFGLLTDAQWRELSDIEPLQLLIGRLKEQRIRDGTAQREKASLRWNSAIDVIDALVRDPATPARSRIDGARELRACAGAGSENTPANERERFVINISFGTHKVVREFKHEPLTIEPDAGDELPMPRETGIINYTR
jgi:hypothetical protein